MSKSHLRKLLNNTENAEMAVFFDSKDVCGRGLVWSNIKSHLRANRKVHYLCYSIHPSKCSPLRSEEDSDNLNLRLYDLYSDPLHWSSNVSDTPPAKKYFENIISLSQYNSTDNLIVVIDKIDCVVKYLNETQIFRSLQALKNAKSVFQVIVYCSEDVASSAFSSGLKSICSSCVTLKPTNPLMCHILLKKKSGKVVKSVEEFSLNSRFELEFCREYKHVAPSNVTLVSNDASDFSFETTFNLSLTDVQKEAKKNLILPHTRVQLSGGQIHYVPEAEDDWDDEDPDDDLEI